MNLIMVETRFPVMSSVRQPAERHDSTDFDIAEKQQFTDRFIGSVRQPAERTMVIKGSIKFEN